MVQPILLPRRLEDAERISANRAAAKSLLL